MGKLLAIAQREKSKSPMIEVNTANVLFDSGVASDFRGRKRGKRQVTVLTEEAWLDSCAEMSKQMPWTTRRANLFIRGFNLENSTGKFLTIGSLKLEITGELEPCNRMDEQFDGLTQVLTPEWRGGVCCKIISEGEIKVGDEVKLEQ